MPDSSIHKQIVEGVVAGVKALTLTGITGGSPLPSSQVYTYLLPSDVNVTLPAVVVSLAPLPEKLEGTLTATDDIGYPVGITILVAKNQDLTIADAELYWRQQIAEKFHHRKPSEVTTLLTGAQLVKIEWEPGNVLDLELYRSANLYASSMIIRVTARKTRP